MQLSSYQIAKICHLSTSISVAEIAKKFDLTTPDLRKMLRASGIKIVRGRKRGSGSLLVVADDANIDRRLKWQLKRISAGLCSGCGKVNRSGSVYHCDDCLKRRSERKKVKNV